MSDALTASPGSSSLTATMAPTRVPHAVRSASAAEIVRGITGRIDLVHANDSQGGPDSGRDRHANFGKGQIDPQLLVAVVKAAGAPVICETADEGRRADIAFLRDNVPS